MLHRGTVSAPLVPRAEHKSRLQHLLVLSTLAIVVIGLLIAIVIVCRKEALNLNSLDAKSSIFIVVPVGCTVAVVGIILRVVYGVHQTVCIPERPYAQYDVQSRMGSTVGQRGLRQLTLPTRALSQSEVSRKKRERPQGLRGVTAPPVLTLNSIANAKAQPYDNTQNCRF